MLFDPFGVVSISPFAPWVTPTAIHIQAPSGAELSKRHTLIQEQWGWGEGNEAKFKLRFLFQGVSDDPVRGKQYGDIPWQLGLLEPEE